MIHRGEAGLQNGKKKIMSNWSSIIGARKVEIVYSDWLPVEKKNKAQTISKKQFFCVRIKSFYRQKTVLKRHYIFKNSSFIKIQGDSFIIYEYNRPCNIDNRIIAPYIIPLNGKMVNKEGIGNKKSLYYRWEEVRS